MQAIFIGVFILAILSAVTAKLLTGPLAGQSSTTASQEEQMGLLNVKDMMNQFQDPDTLMVEGGDELMQLKKDKQKSDRQLLEDSKIAAEEAKERRQAIEQKAKDNQERIEDAKQRLEDQMQILKDKQSNRRF